MGSSMTSYSAIAYPNSQEILAITADTVIAGTWLKGFDALNITASLLNNNPAAQSDEIEWTYIAIETGTYTFTIIAQKSSNAAIMHLIIDGVDVGEVDAYAAILSRNNFLTIPSISLSSGTHTIGIRASTKNVLSSDYSVAINSIYLTRTS